MHDIPDTIDWKRIRELIAATPPQHVKTDGLRNVAMGDRIGVTLPVGIGVIGVGPRTVGKKG